MTVAQYAQHRRVLRAAVYKALTDARIAREADGLIDPVKADAQWAANTSPASRWATGAEDVVLTEMDIDQLLG
jgi:hypothetical protein